MTHYWVGPVRSDNTYAQFIVTISNLSAKDSKLPLLQLCEQVVIGIKQRRLEWSATQPEQGTINGLPFVRCSWSGVVTSAAREGLAGRAMHGIVYVAARDHQLIQIMCQDVAPDHAEWIAQGELAASSVHFVNSESTPP